MNLKWSEYKPNYFRIYDANREINKPGNYPFIVFFPEIQQYKMWRSLPNESWTVITPETAKFYLTYPEECYMEGFL